MDQITSLMHLILCSQFPSTHFPSTLIAICHLVDNIKPKLEFKLVKWNKPIVNEFKLNVDGCSKGNRENAGGGGILRSILAI